jgi:8-oxo-dGTP pyrophosphatase MutT (NUDIX family)
VILDESARIALVSGSKGLFLPGGGARPGESPEQTVAREIREETGRAPTGLRRLGEVIQHFEASGTPYRMRATFFVAELGRTAVGKAEHELLWMSEEAARGKLYHECHAWAIERARSLRDGAR